MDRVIVQMDGPLVTIGMPVFNGERTIVRAIESLLAQTYRNIELVVSDNASTYRTREICEEFARRDERVKYFRNDTNIGVPANFNKLIFQGCGPLFMWAACDDCWEPGFIEEAVESLEGDQSIVLAFCQVDYVDDTTGRSFPGKNSSSMGRPGGVFDRWFNFLVFPEVESKTSLIYGVMRRSILQLFGGLYTGYEPENIFHLDTQTLFPMLMHGGFAISDKVLFHKHFIPGRLEWIIPRPGAIILYYQTYRKQIWKADLRGFERIAIESAALFNLARRLMRNLVGRALARMPMKSLEPVYLKMSLRAQSLFARKGTGGCQERG